MPERRRVIRFIEALLDGQNTESALAAADLTPAAAIDALEQLQLAIGNARRAPLKVKKHDGKLRVTIYSDGASRGNPGKAACAVIVTDDSGEELLRRWKLLGVATNNIAEYEGVLLALEIADTLGADAVTLKLDSELAVKQLKGEYKVKNEDLKPRHAEAKRRSAAFASFEVIHIPRKENAEADKLANAALDGTAE